MGFSEYEWDKKAVLGANFQILGQMILPESTFIKDLLVLLHNDS